MTHAESSLRASIEGAALIAVHVLAPFLRDYRAHWGTSEREIHRSLPGDELVPEAKWEFTHAITIFAPKAEVWHWLVQIGADRGGLYSYEGLENLVGCNMHNADQIIPKYQCLKPGDEIKIHPKAPGMKVVVVEPECSILVHNDNRQPEGGSHINMTWLWHLDAMDATTTRLISRSKNDYSPELSNKLMMGPLLVEPIGFVMERKMMLGIKQRAEEHWMTEPDWAN